MTCEENYESQAAYQELQDLIELISKDIDDIEDDIQHRVSEIKHTDDLRLYKADKRYIELCIRLERAEEIYDRLSDLQESLNVEINNVENNNEGEEYGNRM